MTYKIFNTELSKYSLAGYSIVAIAIFSFIILSIGIAIDNLIILIAGLGVFVSALGAFLVFILIWNKPLRKEGILKGSMKEIKSIFELGLIFVAFAILFIGLLSNIFYG